MKIVASKYFYHVHKCLNANNCWHFNIYEQDEFHDELAWKQFLPWGQEAYVSLHRSYES